MLSHNLNALAPLPWRPVRRQDERGWSYEVLAADGHNIGDREVYCDDAAMMAAVHAFAPEALSYVMAAAAKGGAEASAIVGRFQQTMAALRAGPTEPAAKRHKGA